MRALFVCLLVVFAAPTHGADKDEDKAKEAAAAFLKALVAKDIDALMKTVDVPYMGDIGSAKPQMIYKSDELKDEMTTILKGVRTEVFGPLKVGTAYDMAAFTKFAKENTKPEEVELLIEQVEKVAGKSGYFVRLGEKNKDSGLVIRIKDGKALVAGVTK